MAIGSSNPFPSVLITEGSTPTSPASGKQRVFVDSSSHHLKRVNSSGTVVDIEAGGGGGGGGLYSAYIRVEHQKSAGSNGGTSATDTWTNCPLTTLVDDAGGHASLLSNVVTLDAGTYRVAARQALTTPGTCQLRLWNSTDSAELVLGLSAYEDAETIIALLYGRFVLAMSKDVTLQYRAGAGRSDTGLGNATGWGTNIYASVELFLET